MSRSLCVFLRLFSALSHVISIILAVYSSLSRERESIYIFVTDLKLIIGVKKEKEVEENERELLEHTRDVERVPAGSGSSKKGGNIVRERERN